MELMERYLEGRETGILIKSANKSILGTTETFTHDTIVKEAARYGDTYLPYGWDTSS